MSDRLWRPPGIRHKVPEVGDLLAVRYRAARVLDIQSDDGTVTRYLVRRECGEPFAGENRRREQGLGIQNWGSGPRALAVFASDDFPVCRCHGWPWPCKALDDMEEARRSADYAAVKMARSIPGVCYACGEPVTARQGIVVAPEPNVELPGFPAPAFHARMSCWGGRAHYEQARRRVLGDKWTPFLPESEQAIHLGGAPWLTT